jgi:putative transcriptional regulator
MLDSVRGHFLIAGKQLRDPTFFKTVVLMIEHCDEGAMGLVVNRPTSINMANMLAGHFDIPTTDEVIFSGGPVEPKALFVVHNSPELNGTEAPVVPGVHVASNTDVFERVIQGYITGDDEMEFRIFAGCAGWGAGQLEGELERGDWYVQPATAGMTLDMDPYEVWDSLVKQVHRSHRILPHTTTNPEWN